MFGKAFSSLVVALLLCCPMICGSAPLLHHHGDATPTDNVPHSPHHSCSFDQCFCNGPSVPPHGPGVDLSTSLMTVWATPGDGAAELALCAGYLLAADHPPRLVTSDRRPPLLI